MERETQRPAGRLIALEGIDGSGKTTQAAHLVERLRQAGRTVHRTAEPSSGPIGQLIRRTIAAPANQPVNADRSPAALPDPATLALLFAADRRHHLLTTVEPVLARGDWVVTDRYLLSSLAYQSLGLDLAWIAELNRFARPADLTVFLHLPVAESLARLAGRRGRADVFESSDQLRRIARQYAAGREYLAGLGWPIRTVEAGGTVDQVGDRVWSTLTAALG